MIRINLLNKTTSVQAQGQSISDSGELILSKEETQKQAGLRILILLILPAAVYLYQENILIPDLNGEINQINQEVVKLREYNQKSGPAVAEIKKYEEERKNIEGKIELLNRLAGERSLELELHRFFQRIVPDKTWFNEYVYDQVGGRIVIKAQTFSPQTDIRKLIEEVRANVLFKSVDLTRQQESRFQGQSVEEFELLIMVGKSRESTL